MHIRKGTFLTLLGALAVSVALHAQPEVATTEDESQLVETSPRVPGEQGDNVPWFRVHDLDRTSALTKFRWATQWLLGVGEFEEVRNLYGYELTTTCAMLQSIDDSAARNVDVGIATVVRLPMTGERTAYPRAWKLEPLERRENLSSVKEFCDDVTGDEEQGVERWLTECSDDEGEECFIATGYRIPIDNVEPARQFWTQSGVVERRPTSGWIHIGDWTNLDASSDDDSAVGQTPEIGFSAGDWQDAIVDAGGVGPILARNVTSPPDMIYVFGGANSNEAIGVLPPNSRVEFVDTYADDFGGVWGYAIPESYARQ